MFSFDTEELLRTKQRLKNSIVKNEKLSKHIESLQETISGQNVFIEELTMKLKKLSGKKSASKKAKTQSETEENAASEGD